MNKLAILISFSGAGGVERMVLNLLEGFLAAGVSVDLLTIRADSEHLGRLPRGVQVIPLGAKHNVLAIPAITQYLRREKPIALLAAKDRSIRAAARAIQLAGSKTRLVGRIGTTLSAAIADKPPLLQWWRQAPLAAAYSRVDHIVAVSKGVAEDVHATTAMPASKISVVCNPVITPQLEYQANTPVEHPWFADNSTPVILGAGRLTRQKDFVTLISAFALLRQQQTAKLVIFGEGRQRALLMRTAAELGVSNDVDFPGFEKNIYRYMRNAQLFVLSSAWEGSPNVLTEALALGLPAVATDCPSGPREVLQGGKIGPLIPVGNIQRLSLAMHETLRNPLPASELQAAVAHYTLAASSQRYLEILGVTPPL